MTTTIRNGRGDLITAIGGPCDVQALPESQLPELAVQMRRRLIETVTATGGHLGAGLGMVELTIALHRVFTSPHDIVVFDTGHQTYRTSCSPAAVKTSPRCARPMVYRGIPTAMNRHMTGSRTPMPRSASPGWTASPKHWPCRGNATDVSSR